MEGFDQAFVAERYVFDVGNERFRVLRRRDAEIDREVLETDRPVAFEIVSVRPARHGIGVFKVDRICENGKSACLKRYLFTGDVHLKIVLPGGQFFHVDKAGVYIDGVGSSVVFVLDLIGKSEVDNVNVRNGILSDQIGKLIIQKFKSDGSTARCRLVLHAVLYERNVEKKRVVLVITGVGACVKSLHISVVVIVDRRSIYGSYDKVGAVGYRIPVGKHGRNPDLSVVPGVPPSRLAFLSRTVGIVSDNHDGRLRFACLFCSAGFSYSAVLENR